MRWMSAREVYDGDARHRLDLDHLYSICRVPIVRR
jgi:hypothetical protein